MRVVGMVVVLWCVACGDLPAHEDEGCLNVASGAAAGSVLCHTAQLRASGAVLVNEGDETFRNKLGTTLEPDAVRNMRFFENRSTCLIVEARSDEAVRMKLSHDDPDVIVLVQGHDPSGEQETRFEIARISAGQTFEFVVPPQGQQAEQFGYGQEGQVFFWLNVEPQVLPN